MDRPDFIEDGGLADRMGERQAGEPGAPRTEAEAVRRSWCPADDLGGVHRRGGSIARLAQQSARAKTRYTALSAEYQLSPGNT